MMIRPFFIVKHPRHTGISASLFAENWPQWRGPEATSLAAPGNYPEKFSNTENVIWKVKLPGKGSSTPAVWER